MSVSTTLGSALKVAYTTQNANTAAQPAPLNTLSEDQATAIVSAIVAAINSNTAVTFVLAAPNGPVTGTITLTCTAS